MRSKRVWKKAVGRGRSYLVYRHPRTGQLGLPWQGLVMMSLLLSNEQMSSMEIASDLYGQLLPHNHPVTLMVRAAAGKLEYQEMVVQVDIRPASGSGKGRPSPVWGVTERGREAFELAMALAQGHGVDELSDSVAFAVPAEDWR